MAAVRPWHLANDQSAPKQPGDPTQLHPALSSPGVAGSQAGLGPLALSKGAGIGVGEPHLVGVHCAIQNLQKAAICGVCETYLYHICLCRSALYYPGGPRRVLNRAACLTCPVLYTQEVIMLSTLTAVSMHAYASRFMEGLARRALCCRQGLSSPSEVMLDRSSPFFFIKAIASCGKQLLKVEECEPSIAKP